MRSQAHHPSRHFVPPKQQRPSDSSLGVATTTVEPVHRSTTGSSRCRNRFAPCCCRTAPTISLALPISVCSVAIHPSFTLPRGQGSLTTRAIRSLLKLLARSWIQSHSGQLSSFLE